MNPIKPWFIHRPQQLLLRVLRHFYRPSEVEVRLPWGLPLVIRPGQAIGRAIWHTGLYDLAVSEALHRLVMPGSVCVDVGANIGCLTGLMALRAGKSGHVTAFEPFEDNHRRLLHNLDIANRAVQTLAPVKVHRLGLSSQEGEASLIFEDAGRDVDAGTNDGTPYVGAAHEANRSVTIAISRFDQMITGRVDVMKVDVEGHEAEVLRGAWAALTERRVTHVVFEEHAGFSGSSCAMLEEAGYQIRRLAWTLGGPRLLRKEDKAPARLESPNFIATLEPEIFSRLEQPGWGCLKTSR